MTGPRYVRDIVALLVIVLFLSTPIAILSNGSVAQPSGGVARESALQGASPFGFNFTDPEVTPNAPQYELPLENLSSVENLASIEEWFSLTDTEREFLRENGLVGIDGESSSLNVPGDSAENFASVYSAMERNSLPIFVTTDSLLHSYHIFFDDTLQQIEEDQLYNITMALTRAMITASEQIYNTTSGSFIYTNVYTASSIYGPCVYTFHEPIDLREAARTNIAYLYVALKCLDPSTKLPGYVAADVNSEISKIENHTGFAHSPIFDRSGVHDMLAYKEDYSQYKPRGHYTRSITLERYFKAMMWYGRMGFRVKSGEATIRAIMLSDAMASAVVGEAPGQLLWSKVDDVAGFFVGHSDDLDHRDYQRISQEVYGEFSSNYTELLSAGKLDEYRAMVKKLGAPLVCSDLVDVSTEDQAMGTMAMRFMGQRLVPDAYIHQRLIFPGVLWYTGTGQPPTLSVTESGKNVRGSPCGFDVMGVLGSDMAEDYLLSRGDTEYENYTREYAGLQMEFDQLPNETWSQNLYWGWMHTMRSLNINFSAGNYPTFMRTRAWHAEKLNTVLASWAELRHDTILYAKQPYSGGDGNGGPPPVLPGYMEPIPNFFSRLVQLTNATIDGLNDIGVLEEKQEESLVGFRYHLMCYQAIAEKELAGEALSDSDISQMNGIGGSLDALMKYIDYDNQDTRMVADVATDPNRDPADDVSNKCLEEGTGYINYVIVIVKDPDGTLRAAVGPTMSFHEFKQPISNRLNDDQWKAMLDGGSAPPYFNWMDYPPDMGRIVDEYPYVDAGISPAGMTLVQNSSYVDLSVNISNNGECSLNTAAEFYCLTDTGEQFIGSTPLHLVPGQTVAAGITWNALGTNSGVQKIRVMLSIVRPLDQHHSNDARTFGVVLDVTDTDGDGITDAFDVFPLDPTEWSDSDGDGVGNNADAFPYDRNETTDTDGDGVGDNRDAFPYDRNETTDTDGDGVGDNSDAFPYDRNETTDTDGDGVGDSVDTFPLDPSASVDSDGDGHPDHWNAGADGSSGTLTLDRYPNDASRWEFEERRDPVRDVLVVLALCVLDGLVVLSLEVTMRRFRK